MDISINSSLYNVLSCRSGLESDQPASAPPASLSLHLASSYIIQATSVHKSRGDNNNAFIYGIYIWHLYMAELEIDKEDVHGRSKWRRIVNVMKRKSDNKPIIYIQLPAQWRLCE